MTFRFPQGYAAVCHGFVVTHRSGYRNKRIGISVDAPLKKCSAYGADIITPHLPQAASSPQAPQGEDNWVRCKFCTNIAQSHGVRGNYGFLRTLDTGIPQYAYP